MANYQYSGDLVDDILWRAGEPTDGTSDFNAVALTYLNRAYQAVWMGGSEIDPSLQEEWWWLRKDPPGVLTLEPRITTGTVNVQNNNTGITFSSAPASDLDNWFFQVDDHADVFRISAHTAGAAAATLDAVYTGDTNATASYKVFKLEYAIASDVLRLLSPMRIYQDSKREVDGVPLTELERRYPLYNVQSGVPELFAPITESKVRFNRYGGTSSTDFMRTEYDYLYRPADLTDSGSQEPVVPRQFRKTLADAGVFFLFMDKNDNRASAAADLARAGLRAMKRENQHRWASMSRAYGKIMPRQQDLDEYRFPLRTESGLLIG